MLFRSPGSFRPAARNEHLYSYCNFTGPVVETAGKSLRLDERGGLIGIFTDGDLRRLMERRGAEAFRVPIEEAMTPNPRTIAPDSLAAEAVRVMERMEISVLVARRRRCVPGRPCHPGPGRGCDRRGQGRGP